MGNRLWGPLDCRDLHPRSNEQGASSKSLRRVSAHGFGCDTQQLNQRFCSDCAKQSLVPQEVDYESGPIDQKRRKSCTPAYASTGGSS